MKPDSFNTNHTSEAEHLANILVSMKRDISYEGNKSPDWLTSGAPSHAVRAVIFADRRFNVPPPGFTAPPVRMSIQPRHFTGITFPTSPFTLETMETFFDSTYRSIVAVITDSMTANLAPGHWPALAQQLSIATTSMGLAVNTIKTLFELEERLCPENEPWNQAARPIIRQFRDSCLLKALTAMRETESIKEWFEGLNRMTDGGLLCQTQILDYFYGNEDAT